MGHDNHSFMSGYLLLVYTPLGICGRVECPAAPVPTALLPPRAPSHARWRRCQTWTAGPCGLRDAATGDAWSAALTVVAVRRSRPGLVILVATVMLVEVMLPQVPLALFSGGCAPDPIIP
jgi:hypothetical protein